MTDRDRRVAIGAAMEAGFDGYLPRLERRRTVCDLPAIESIEFCEDEGRVLVSLVVPFKDVSTLLSPLTLEMVEKAAADVRSQLTLSVIEQSPSESVAQGLCRIINGFEDTLMQRLRQQMEGERGG